MKNTTVQIGFVLGRDTALSVAEIFAYLKRIDVSPLAQTLVGDILILDLEGKSSEKISIDSLGGTIKVFTVIGNFANADEVTEKLLTEIPYESDKRVNFGVSGYGNVNKQLVLKVGYAVKARLTESGYAARFVTGKTVDLSSVIVHENKLIERGFEAIILKSENGFLLGKTSAVQDYRAYSKRDFGRPKRDDRNGMLPPKLAQILINLAAVPLGSSVYDPFCGSGTILQEALFLGYRELYGSDIEKKNIADTKENLDWLYRGFGMPKVADDNVFVSDILTPAKQIKADAIVGEGFLGDPVRRHKPQALADVTKLAQFYMKVLGNMRDQLADEGTIVLAIPFFIVEKEYFYLPLQDFAKIGLTAVGYTPKELPIRRTGRGNLTYSRPDQFVGREILVLKKS